MDAGADVRFIELDVTKAEQITAVAKLIRTEHGRLDVLVNNAGKPANATLQPHQRLSHTA